LAEAPGNEQDVKPRYYIQNDLFRYLNHLDYQEKAREEGVEEKGNKITREKLENKESQPVSNKPEPSQSQYQRSKAPEVRKPPQPIQVTQPAALSWADRTKKLDDPVLTVSVSHPAHVAGRASPSSGPAGGGYEEERDLSSSLFISNIPYTVNPSQVHNAFASAVKGISIKNLKLISEKGYGFVHFHNPEMAMQFYQVVSQNPISLDGRELRVEQRQPSGGRGGRSGTRGRGGVGRGGNRT